MLRAITQSDVIAAKTLLAEGFPDRSRAFWADVFTRMDRFGGNAAAGVPYGYFLDHAGAPVGLILTPALMRADTDTAPVRVINFSSWYIRAEHRWRAVPMLRAIMRTHPAMFTDLTPTPDVQRLLPSLGFQQLSGGTVLHVLPLAAVGPARGARVTSDLSCLAPDVRTLLEAHRQIDCLAFALEGPGGATGIIVKRRRIRRVSAATLVYAGSNAHLDQCFPVFARALLARGILGLVTDANAFANRPGHVVHRDGARFATRPPDSMTPDRRLSLARGVTDYAGSELAIIDF